MEEALYPVIEVQPEWVLEPEAMGSKEKFWYRDREHQAWDWLFKYPKEGTGQHWAEKVAAELAAALHIRHAPVELGIFQGRRGSVTESFARDGRNLFHGNQVLAGFVLGYDPAGTFRHSGHTLDNIRTALELAFAYEHGRQRAKLAMAEYLVFDALIANVDRHHENWGLLRKKVDGEWQGFVAPTFDHASSLGREILEDRRDLLLRENRVGQYVEKGRGGVFWEETEKRGPSPLELIRRAIRRYPEEFRPAVEKIGLFRAEILDHILARVPPDWMTPLEREFTHAVVGYTHCELRKLLT